MASFLSSAGAGAPPPPSDIRTYPHTHRFILLLFNYYNFPLDQPSHKHVPGRSSSCLFGTRAHRLLASAAAGGLGGCRPLVASQSMLPIRIHSSYTMPKMTTKKKTKVTTTTKMTTEMKTIRNACNSSENSARSRLVDT